jgi:hypothetical protein
MEPEQKRKDCIVKVNCIEVKAVPVGLRGSVHPIHRALLEIIEEKGKDGQISIKEMMEELNRRQGGKQNG